MKIVEMFTMLVLCATTAAAQAPISNQELDASLLVCGRHSIGKSPNTGLIVHEPGWEGCTALRAEKAKRDAAYEQIKARDNPALLPHVNQAIGEPAR